MVCGACVAVPAGLAASGVFGMKAKKTFKRYNKPLTALGVILTLISIYYICIFFMKKNRENKKNIKRKLEEEKDKVANAIV